MKVKHALAGVVLGTVVCGGIYFTQIADTGEPVAVEPVPSAPPVESISGEVLPEHEGTGGELPTLQGSGVEITPYTE